MSATQAWGWALVHFFWQGAALAAVLGALLALTRRRSANLRYLLALAGLLFMAALPPVTALQIHRASADAASNVEAVPAERSMQEKWEPQPSPVFVAANQGPAADDVSNGQATGPSNAGTSDGASSSGAAGTIGAVGTFVRGVRGALEPALGWLVGVWLVGVILLSVRLVGGLQRVSRLTRAGAARASDDCRALVAYLASRLGIRRAVRVFESTAVRVPAVIGWLRPVVLLPASLVTGLSAQQLEALVAHELAHIRRHDYLVNLIQTAIETLLFYHPAVWWVSQRIREEREAVCDDLAVQVCGDAGEYAGALLRLESLRSDTPALAPAASSGNLSRRVRRLLGLEPVRAEILPRWAAGLAAALVALAVIAGTRLPHLNADETADTPVTFPAEGGEEEMRPMFIAGSPASESGAIEELRGVDPSDPKASDLQQQRTQSAEPDTVIIYRGDAPLAERWRWAQQVAREGNLSAYWIAYAIDAHPSIDGWVYMDRFTSISGRNFTMTGDLVIGGLSDLRFGGVRLGPLVGERSPDDVALMIGYDRAGRGDAALSRVRAGSFILPVQFEGRALIWLGDAEDRTSVAQLQELYRSTDTAKLKADIVSAVGLHGDAVVVVPALTRWLEGNEPDDVREEAAEGLGYQADPRALAVLARAARGDRSRDVREEAAEAIGDMPLAAATDTLIVLARTLDDPDTRQEAVESLGDRREDRVIDVLADIARDDPDADVQEEAVETLGEFGEAAVRQLVEIAESHPSIDARREAVETLGEAARPEDALRILRDIAWRNPYTDVQEEAVETLGELKGPEVTNVLVEIIDDHPHVDVQREAVETLVEVAPRERAIGELARIARAHRHTDVQQEAVESLGDLDDTRALEPLAELARTHPRVDVRREAVETYAEAAPVADALAFLVRVAREDANPDVQQEAVESLGELRTSEVITILEQIATTHPNPDVAMEAVESIGEAASLDEAVRVLSQIAESHPRVDVQREAVETLGELGTPEALTRVAQIAKTHPRVDVRDEAVETYGEEAVGEDAAKLLAEIARHDPSHDVQREALEALAELRDGAGIPLLIEIARSHPDLDVRRRALEELADSDDPRAVAAIKRMLEGK